MSVTGPSLVKETCISAPKTPVATMVEVARLADPAHLVEVEVEAYVGR